MNHATQRRMAKSEAGLSERKTVNFHIASDNPDQENESFILNEESSIKSDDKDSKNNQARKNPFTIFKFHVLIPERLDQRMLYYCWSDLCMEISFEWNILI